MEKDNHLSAKDKRERFRQQSPERHYQSKVDKERITGVKLVPLSKDSLVDIHFIGIDGERYKLLVRENELLDSLSLFMKAPFLKEVTV